MQDDDRTLFEIADRHQLRPGAADREFRDELGIVSPIRGWQRVNRSLDDDAALLAEPQLVLRLRRIRDQRLGQRNAS